MGIRVNGAPAAFAPRMREITSGVDVRCGSTRCAALTTGPGQSNCRRIVAASGLAAVVGLGLFLSAAAIFSLMSVTACLEPARRALTIDPATALRDT